MRLSHTMVWQLESLLLVLSSPLPINLSAKTTRHTWSPIAMGIAAPTLRVGCRAARRRVRIDEGDEDVHNKEIEMLEVYTQSATKEVLIVHALLDEQDVELLIFKGFSSSLSYGTSPNPSTSVLPARAAIKFIDRIEGPFDPSNIHYLEKAVTWEAFKSRLSST